MNDLPQTDEPATAISDGAAAFRLGALLLAGLVAMLVLAAYDRQRRSALETWSEDTAAGDRAFLTLATAPPPALTWNGHALEVLAEKRYKLPDSRLRRIGRDAAAGVAIYEYRGPASKEITALAATGREVFFVKIGLGEYLAVRP